eukprot:PhF_6_TR6000/c0_g1_i2/m.8655
MSADPSVIGALIVNELQEMISDNQYPNQCATILMHIANLTNNSSENPFLSCVDSEGTSSTDIPDRESVVRCLATRLSLKSGLVKEYLFMSVAEMCTMSASVPTLEAELVTLQREVDTLTVEYVSHMERNISQYQAMCVQFSSEMPPLLEKKLETLEAAEDLAEGKVRYNTAKLEADMYNSWTIPALKNIMSHLNKSIADLTASEAKLRQARTSS